MYVAGKHTYTSPRKYVLGKTVSLDIMYGPSGTLGLLPRVGDSFSLRREKVVYINISFLSQS
jgi:hypothetical protein